MTELYLGIVIGLITTFILWMIKLFWGKILSPAIQNYIYKGVQIEGRWKSAYPDWDTNQDNIDDYIEEIIIHRKGHEVNGIMKVLTGGDQGREYDFSGSFYNNILTVTYVTQDRSSLDRGCYSMMLKENGRKFNGFSTFYDDDQHDIVTHSYEWIKQ